jgi:hypothetical protein
MKCWNLAFNAQGSRVIIVLLEVGVKVYVATVEALRQKERGDETQFTTKIGGKISLGPRLPVIHLMAYYAETGHSRPLIGWLYG